MNSKNIFLQFVFSITLLFLFVIDKNTACSQTVSTWSVNPKSTDWFDPANWTDGVPNAPGDIARIIDNSIGIREANISAEAILGQIGLLGSRQMLISGAGPLTFNNPGSSSALVQTILPRGTQGVQAEIASHISVADEQGLTISLVGSNSLILSGQIISTDGDITKNGTGPLTLSGDNSRWQGAFEITEGDVILEHMNALGDEVGVTTLNGGRVLIEDEPVPPRIMARSGINGPLNESFILNAGVLETTQHFLPVNGTIELPVGNTAIIRGPFSLQGGTTGDGDLRIVATDFAASDISNIPLGHTGSVDISSGELSRQFAAFRIDNHYEGVTTINNIELSVRTPGGLGSTSEGTTISNGSNLRLHGGSAEDVKVIDSTLSLWSAETTLPELQSKGQFTLKNSVLTTYGTFRGAEVYKIEKPVVLEGGLNEIKTSKGGIQLQGGIVGSGDLLLNPSGIHAIEVASNIQNDGMLEVRGGGTVRFTAPNVFSKDLIVQNSGRIVIEALQTFGTIATAHRSQSGIIEVAPGSLLTADAVNLFQGTIQGNVQTDGPLQFRGFAGRRTIRNLESGIDVEVYGGDLAIDDSDQSRPTTSSKISILRESKASILLERDSVTDAVFMLNNGSGFNFGGALRTENDGNGDPTIIVRGDIDLGNRGAHIGGSDGIIVEGQIRGGDLHLGRVLGNPSLILGQRELEYVGKTNIYSGNIQLKDAGRLQNTSGIHIHSEGALYVDSSANEGPLLNRIADEIPIFLYGGELSAWPTEVGTNTTERVGQVNAVRGISSLLGTNNTNGLNSLARAELIVGELNRTRGAVLTTIPRRPRDFDIGSQAVALLKVYNAPMVVNGLLPAWIVESVNFTTLDNNGHVVGYQGPFESFNTANETSIVRPPSSPSNLSEDKVVHAIYAFGNVGPVDFGGHTVTVGNGGVSGADFSNGKIQPGDHANGELIFFGGANIEVDIVDNGVPTSVTIVGDAELGGNNTYTGKTYIVGRPGDDVRVNKASALPTGGDIEISGYTDLFLRDLSGNFAYQFGSVAIRDGGSLGAQCCGNGDTVTADDILLEEGRLSVPLVGDTVITKQTEGLGKITMASPGFTGRVNIEQGSLLVGESIDGYTALGAADVIVHPNANLILSPVSNSLAQLAPTPKIMLQGGSLFGTGRFRDDQISLKGTIEVLEPSQIYTMDGLEADPRDVDFKIDGKVHIPTGKSLSVISIFNSGGGLYVSEGFELEPGSILGGNGSILSNVKISDGAILSPGLLTKGSTPGALHMSVPSFVSDLDKSSLTWGENGRYQWEINSVEGLAGADFGEGWDLVNAGPKLIISATPENPFVIEMVSLDADGHYGEINDLMTNVNYRWKIAEVAQINAFVGTITGFDADKFRIDLSNLHKFYPQAREEDFFIERVGPAIFLNGVIVPEPSTMLILLGISVMAFASRRY